MNTGFDVVGNVRTNDNFVTIIMTANIICFQYFEKIWFFTSVIVKETLLGEWLIYVSLDD